MQGTDVVSSLRKALQKHKASFIPQSEWLTCAWCKGVVLGCFLRLCSRTVVSHVAGQLVDLAVGL